MVAKKQANIGFKLVEMSELLLCAGCPVAKYKNFFVWNYVQTFCIETDILPRKIISLFVLPYLVPCLTYVYAACYVLKCPSCCFSHVVLISLKSTFTINLWAVLVKVSQPHPLDSSLHVDAFV